MDTLRIIIWGSMNQTDKHLFKNFFKIIISNLLVLFFLFSILEIISRLFFPEFNGHIHSDTKTMGINKKYTNFGKFSTRSSSEFVQNSKSKPVIIIFGDSISDRYGLDSEDIWWKQLEKL